MVEKTQQTDAFFLTLAGLFNLNLAAISKMRLRAHGGVANRLKMLTYYRVCSEQRLLSRPAP